MGAMGATRIFIWLALAHFAAANVRLGKHIVKYTEEKLDYVLAQSDRPPIFLEIYSPTCPACQSLAPRMSAAAAKLKDLNPEIKVVALDGTQAEVTMQRLGAAEFPSLFFLGNATHRLELRDADSAEAIAHWARRMAAPAVERGAPSAATELPQLVLRARQMIPAFETVAEEQKLNFEAFWIEGSENTAEIRHQGQKEVSFTWSDLTADTLDDEGQRFEAFVKDSLVPAIIMVKEPKKAIKMLEGHQDAVLLWLLLNASDVQACEESCSTSGKGNLEKALAPHRPLLDEALRLYRADVSSTGQSKKAFALAVDLAQWPNFAEQELYAWEAPRLIAQRFHHGPRYFYADNATLPASPEMLHSWLKGLIRRSPRQMSERPPSQQPKLWRRVVNLGLEEQLRAEPATLLYALKSPDSISHEEEVLEFEEEMESLDALAEWLNKSCARPPVLAALDVRKNDVPLSLYAAANIGGLNAPSLYWIESDVGQKPSGGIRWAGEITELEKDSKQKLVLAGKLNSVVPWILERARGNKAFAVPESPTLSFPQRAMRVRELQREEEVLQLLASNLSGFMEFFSPECGACKKFAPAYESAARKAPTFTFARLDCSTAQGEKSCNLRGIEKYPTVFYMDHGRLAPYAGGPKRDHLLDYLEMQSSPLEHRVTSEEEAWALVKKPVLLAAGHGALVEAARKAAEGVRAQVKFATMPADLEALVLLWPGRVRRQPPDDITAEDVELWLAEQLVKSAAVGPETRPVRTVVGSNFRQMVYGPLAQGQHVILEVYAPWCGHCKKLAPAYEEFARTMEEEGRQLVVAKLDGDANGIAFDGFSYTGYPTIFYLSPDSEEILKVKERTLEGLLSFVRKMHIPGKAGSKAAEEDSTPSMEKLLSRFRSEELPVTQSQPVLTVVLKNFVDVVFSETRHCLLMLYDKNCPHCGRMMPEFEALASQVTKDVFLARMDGKLNDLPMSGFRLQGFPTLYLVEAGQKEPSVTEVGSGALGMLRQLLQSKGWLSKEEL